MNLRRQAMHVYRNNEVRSRNHCSHGTAISVTYSSSVIQHAKGMHRITLSPFARMTTIFLSLSRSITIFDTISETVHFSETIY